MSSSERTTARSVTNCPGSGRKERSSISSAFMDSGSFASVASVVSPVIRKTRHSTEATSATPQAANVLPGLAAHARAMRSVTPI